MVILLTKEGVNHSNKAWVPNNYMVKCLGLRKSVTDSLGFDGMV